MRTRPDASWVGPDASWVGPDSATSRLDEMRKKLALLQLSGRAGGGGGRRGGFGAPIFGGLGRGTHSSVDYPEAALPALSFNPFLAQQSRGVPNLMRPTAVSDNAPPPGHATPGQIEASGPPAVGFHGQDQAEAPGAAPSPYRPPVTPAPASAAASSGMSYTPAPSGATRQLVQSGAPAPSPLADFQGIKAQFQATDPFRVYVSRMMRGF